MEALFSKNRTFKRRVVSILSIVVILAMAFPAQTVSYASSASGALQSANHQDLDLNGLITVAQQEGTLTVIALPNDWCSFGSLINGFTDKYGIPVNSVSPSASSEEELQAIRDGIHNPGPDTPDVIDVGPGFAVQAKLEGLIAPYQVATWDKIPDAMKDGEGYWYGDYYGVMSIAANTNSYSPPASWADLLTGENIGPVALGGDPTVSNMGLFSVYAAALANGGSLDDIGPGLDFFKNLQDAGRLLPDIGNGGTLTSNETPVLLEWSYLALTQRDADPSAQIEVVVPGPNPVASFYAQAVSAYAPHPNAARLWMEYLYSDEGQLAFLNSYCFPARFDDLLARGIIPNDLLARLPDLTGAFFPSLEQIGAAEADVDANWACTVYGDHCIWRDEFNALPGAPWFWMNENPEKRSIRDGFLNIYASPAGTGSENLLLKPVAPGDFMIKTRVFFEPDTNFQFAGLVIWQDEGNFLQFGRAFCDVEGACVGNGIYFDKILGGGFSDGNFATQFDNPFNPAESYLRLERRGDMVRAFYSHEGITWTEIGTHWIPEDFQVNAVGLTASQDNSGLNIPADFDFFELSEGWGFLPEGFHDYDSGDLPAWACNEGVGVGGWAADPDDRESDLAIEVNVDGTSLPEWLYAGAYREDLHQAGVCVDGNCSFSTSLPGPFSLYEPHSVVVYAQDIPSGEWVTLSNSPKTFTCRTYDIYTFDPVTGGTKQVTNLPDTHEYNPRWSPDGKKIVHDTWDTDWSAHGVYITDVKTGISAPLAGAEGGSYPAWSPSGKWIAFDRGADNDYRVFIVAPTGGTPKLVAEDAFMPTWAPKSQRLAFHRPSDGGIWTTDLDGENQTKVAERGNGPAWSPDGEWIAFEVDGDVWKVRVNNGGNPFGEPIQLTTSPLWEGRPTWSYNSKTIAFHAGMGQDTDIWTIPAAGGEATWLTGAPNFGDYDANYSLKGQSTYISYSSFSPDGQAARTWTADFSYDAGTWTEGEHSYYLENTYSVPEPWSGTSEVNTFNVSTDAPQYNGYALLRGFGLRARVGKDCPSIDPLLHPDQNTRFGYGWQTDFPMTYVEAVAHFNSMAVKAHWDGGMSADLQRHEIIPSSSMDWGTYICSLTEALPEPVLYIHYEYPDVVEGDYELGHTVQVTVFDNDGTIKATATVETMEMPHWGGAPGFRVEQWDGLDGPPDLQPGDVVRAVVDGGPLTVETRIGEISGTIDLDTNSITGTINAPWAGDLVNVMCSPWGAPGGASDKETTVAPDGVSQFTCTWDSSEWNIQPGETVGVSYWGNDLHSIANAISNPWIMAFPEANQVFGYGWPVDSGVSLSINDEEIATVTVEGAPWNENDIMAFFDFGAQHVLVAGDVVTLSGSGMVRTHIVQNLAVDEVNMAADTVSGTADAGANIHAWVHEFGHDVQVDAIDGIWEAYFGSEDFQLQPGMCGQAEIRVEGNNSTNADWCTPPKMDLRVNYGHDWVESFYEAGHQVTISVTDSEGNVKATAEAFTGPRQEWEGATGFQTTPESWSPAPPDLQPYDWVYARVDNGVTAQVQLGDIQGIVNFQTDSVAGTILADWLSDPVPVECLDWGSGQAPPFENKDGGSHLTNASDPYSCSWEGEWDVQPWQDIGVGYLTPEGHWVANAFRDERWMAYWTYTPDPPTGLFLEGEHSYSYQWAYTTPVSDGGTSGLRTIAIAGDPTSLYDGFALIGPWGWDYPGNFRPQLAWTGTTCEAVSVLHLDQPVRFVWGWVNDYSMTYDEALAHFNSLIIEASWDLFSDGRTDGSASLATMTDLVPFTGREDRFEYLCTLTGQP